MQVQIEGDTFPKVEATLSLGESILAEPGEFLWMSSSIRMHTSAVTAGASNMLGAVKRMIAGGGLFMTEYTAEGRPGTVAFAAKIPGQIIPVDVNPQNAFLIHRHGFLCGSNGIELGLGFQRSFTAGLFGGSGFILQRLSGLGRAWVELGGQVTEKNLASGEEMYAHPGYVGMFEESVTFEITLVPGIRNLFFGGNGVSIARLRGPGKVWLQSMTLPNFAHALAPYIGGDTTANVEQGIGGGIVGAVVRGFFK